MRRISSVAFSALLLAIPMSVSSVAQERHDERRDEHRDERRDGHRDDRRDELRNRFDERGWGWRGEIHDFRGHDFDVWRGGRWYQGPYDGREGWWWVVGDAWYPYAA
ncbi:MAG TPA: hypothetical protein VET85_09020, partial [Stellaceae bacterium]|nr:hypothetical protein [Stellaceae bacterium]